MNHFRSKVPALVAMALLAACSGTPTDGGGGGARVIKANPSFATDIQEIINRIGCNGAGCHGAAGGQAGFVLGSDASVNRGNLVNVSSTSEPSFLRVEPNDAVNSYIVIKLEGRQSVGSRMPLGLPALDNIDLTNIKNWINTGAPDN